MTMRAARLLGALSILGVGAVHLQQYSGNGYSTVPTIGTLFLLNAISAGVVGFGLLLPLQRMLGRRRGNAAVGVLSLAGLAIAVGAGATVLLTPLAAVSIRRALVRRPQRPGRPAGYAASRSA